MFKDICKWDLLPLMVSIDYANFFEMLSTGGLRVPERRRVAIDFYGVNITIPDSMESAPEPIAAISRGQYSALFWANAVSQLCD